MIRIKIAFLRCWKLENLSKEPILDKYYFFCDHDYLSVLNNNPPSSSPPHFYDE